MAVEVTVTGGAEQLRALARDLKAAGVEGQGLRRELLAGMRAVGKPLADKTKAHAREILPRKGGLNEWVAASDVKVKNNLTGSASRVGMRIVAKKGGRHLQDMDSGKMRHPVYGNKKKWVAQEIPEGWFSTPLGESAPEVIAILGVTMNVIGRRIEGV